MAVAGISLDGVIQKARCAVYCKWIWTDPWILMPYIEPMTAARATAPTISTATFKMRYGSGKWEDMTDFTDGSNMQSYRYCYIQIRARRGENETLLWTGIIETETFKLLGQSGAKKADQIIQAHGLEVLLKNRLDGAWVLSAGEEEQPKWINYIPVFNRQHEYGGNIMGNRSGMLATEKLTYIFSAEGEVWDNYEIANYLIAHYQQGTGPDFGISGDEAVINALKGLKGVYKFSSMTVLDALNKLINRSRGFGWYVSVAKNYVGNDDFVDIVPFSMLDEDIKLGDIIMPANPKKVPVDLWTEQTHTTAEVTSSIVNTFDRIVVQGSRMKSCCTLSFDKGLKKAWSDEEETAFKNACNETDGYDELGDDEQADKNDKFRAEDRFERVFTTFRIPHDWDWVVGSGEDAEIVNPLLDTSVGMLNLEMQAPHWNADKRLAGTLPLKIGIDYSGSAPIDNNPDYAEPEYRCMFVLVKDTDGKYQYADRIAPYHARVRPLTREAAVEMRFNPQYLASKNHWTEAEPAKYEGVIELDGIDYEDIVVTAFLETDQVVQVEFSLGSFENPRTLVIDLPDCELWYIVPGTIIGIDENGDLIEYGVVTPSVPTLLRDDTERLFSALAAAVAWYGKQRNKIVITIKDIDAGIPIGTLIENVDVADVGAIGSVVTELRWDFQSRSVSTTIITDHGELDIAGIFSSNVVVR
ncbi:MAG: hypothetical protein PHY02_06295 [Phycisphaerae bacterium]|nr:hypothetical protein [Phycisphaerae bacterium]